MHGSKPLVSFTTSIYTHNLKGQCRGITVLCHKNSYCAACLLVLSPWKKRDTSMGLTLLHASFQFLNLACNRGTACDKGPCGSTTLPMGVMQDRCLWSVNFGGGNFVTCRSTMKPNLLYSMIMSCQYYSWLYGAHPSHQRVHW